MLNVAVRMPYISKISIVTITLPIAKLSRILKPIESTFTLYIFYYLLLCKIETFFYSAYVNIKRFFQFQFLFLIVGEINTQQHNS